MWGVGECYKVRTPSRLVKVHISDQPCTFVCVIVLEVHLEFEPALCGCLGTKGTSWCKGMSGTKSMHLLCATQTLAPLGALNVQIPTPRFPFEPRVSGTASGRSRRHGLIGPLGPLGFNSPNIAQRHALHVERTAEKAVMLSDRVQLSSAEEDGVGGLEEETGECAV